MNAPGVTKTAIPCSCGCSVAVMTDLETYGDDPREVFVEFYVNSARGRLRAAWRVLRGRDPWLHSVCLDYDGIEKLRAALARESR